ncbi:MAG TPA: hypothetical protein VF575_03370 [Candidatus Saccharimonadales bacterium]
MSTQNQPQPAEPPKHTEQGVAVELSAEALHNLTGYFDVLIQMDFAQKQRNKLRSQSNDRVRTTKDNGASGA